jgi:hypothetical protein
MKKSRIVEIYRSSDNSIYIVKDNKAYYITKAGKLVETEFMRNVRINCGQYKTAKFLVSWSERR